MKISKLLFGKWMAIYFSSCYILYLLMPNDVLSRFPFLKTYTYVLQIFRGVVYAKEYYPPFAEATVLYAAMLWTIVPFMIFYIARNGDASEKTIRKINLEFSKNALLSFVFYFFYFFLIFCSYMFDGCYFINRRMCQIFYENTDCGKIFGDNRITVGILIFISPFLFIASFSYVCLIIKKRMVNKCPYQDDLDMEKEKLVFKIRHKENKCIYYIRLYWYSIKKFRIPKGRSSKGEYWNFIVLNIIISILISIIEYYIRGNYLFAKAFSKLLFCLTFCIGIRRLHDTGRSGWWILLSPFIIHMLLQNGQPGENKYGPDPKLELEGKTAHIQPDTEDKL